MPCSCDRRGMWDRRENVIVSLVVKWLGSTTLGGSKIFENNHHPDKLKTNDYLPSNPSCFKPAQPLTDDMHELLEKDPNDYHLLTHNSHYETKEVSSDEDVDEWLNEELSKRMTGQDTEEEEYALIDILKTVVEECKSIYKKAQIQTPSSRTSEIQGVSFVAEEEEGESFETLPCKQQSNEINPKGFTLPCTINNLKIYDMADVGAGINMMPKSLFEHLKLTNLKKTSRVVEMADMTKKAPLGIVENIPVKIDKFLFRSDFVVIDTLEGPNETMLLASSIQKDEYFNPHEVKNDDSPALEQRTLHYSEESIDTVDSSNDSQEDEVGSHLSEDVVSRWHVCKPVHVTFKVCEEDCGIWPTCNLDLSFCSGYDAIYRKEKNGMLKQWVCFRDRERQSVGGNGMKYADFLKVRYGNKNIDDITRERRYYEWVAQNYDFNIKTTKYVDPYDSHHENSHDYENIPNDTLRINTYFPDVPQTQLKKPRLRDNLFKEWVKENFDFEGNFERTRDNPYSRNFEVYKEEFDDEIKQLENEYELKAGRKRYALEEVWDKCEKFHDSTKLWYDKGFEEEELWQNGIEETDYTPLNYGVICEDEAKRRNYGPKTKTFEENYYLLPYAVVHDTDLMESNSLEFDQFSDIEEHIEEEVIEIMAETMKQYMSKTSGEYGSGVARPKIDANAQFELKGKFLK
ncbi:phospholipase-like protein [Tanacetum coccineum]